MHAILFIFIVGVIPTLIIFLLTSAMGWSMGYMNEKYANGSIMPSWLLHGISNFIMALLAMFGLM